MLFRTRMVYKSAIAKTRTALETRSTNTCRIGCRTRELYLPVTHRDLSWSAHKPCSTGKPSIIQRASVGRQFSAGLHWKRPNVSGMSGNHRSDFREPAIGVQYAQTQNHRAYLARWRHPDDQRSGGRFPIR